MTPYPNASSPLQKLFNKFMSSSRLAIEQAWGEMSSRFRFMRTDITWMSLDWECEVSRLIYGTMLLHNLCKQAKDPPFDLEPQDFALIGQDVVDDTDVAYSPEQDASAIRNALAVLVGQEYELDASGQLIRK